MASLATAGSAAVEPLPVAGPPVERTIAGGGADVYTVDLTAGEVLLLNVEQRGIDLVLHLDGPDGARRLDQDSPNGAHGTESLSFIADVSGTYRLTVAAGAARAAPGGYRLEVVARRPAGADDAARVAAERAEYRGMMAAWGEGTADSRRRAVEEYEAALEIWRRLGERRRQAEVLDDLRAIDDILGESRREMERLEEALALWTELGEPARVATEINNLGQVTERLGEPDAAAAYLERARTMFAAQGNLLDEAKALSNLGSLERRRGRLDAAADDFTAALALLRRLDDRRQQARTLNNLGLVRLQQGRFTAAREHLSEALALARAVPDPAAEAGALNNLGRADDEQGRLQDAIDHYRQALDLDTARGYRLGQAFAVNNLAAVYARLGQAAEAAEHFRRALALYREVGDRSSAGRAVANLAWVELQLGRLDDAAAHLDEAAAAADEVDNRELAVLTLDLRAEAEVRRERPAAARELAGRAVAAAEDLGAPLLLASALRVSGLAALADGDPGAARPPLERALRLCHEAGQTLGEADVLYRLARTDRQLADLDAARAEMAAAIDRLEEVRAGVAVEGLRSSFVADRKEIYEESVDLLMELDRRRPGEGYDGRALEASERARARSLLDLLAEARVDLRRDASPELRGREAELRDRLDALDRRRREALAGATDPAAAADLVRQIRAVREEHQAVEARMRTSSPRYAALAPARPPDLATLQREVLDAGTTLLEYGLGSRRSFLWVVDAGELHTFTLPGRAEIERRARAFHDLVRTPGEDGPALAAAGAALTEVLLAPARDLLADRRLVVVADGALHYVPFAALPDPAAPPGAPPPPLVVGHEIVGAPSAAVLAALRREGPSAAAETLAVFADPVFEADDPRVEPAAAPRSADEPGAGLDFRRLRFSRREAEGIAALVPAGERMVALGFAASRDAVEGDRLERFRWIHFATHGVLDARFPELSGLVLSRVGPRGEPRDGFLRLQDIYGLRLDADMVALSACRTALGAEIRGEGLVGLTRGFMYAGARRVLASLWDVQDRATAEIMVRLYRGILVEGRAPVAALRDAQVSMWRDGRWHAPYDWAGFVLEGPWD